jgi:hypothetical protein
MFLSEQTKKSNFVVEKDGLGRVKTQFVLVLFSKSVTNFT